MEADSITVNRAPVLTLWAAVVTCCLGHNWPEALSLGRGVAGLNAQAKGRRLGLFGQPNAPEGGGVPRKTGLGEDHWVEVCGRPVPAVHTGDGVRAVVKDQPIAPDTVERYLNKAFGAALPRVRQAMEDLAHSLPPDELRQRAYALYEQFRPAVAPGQRGWGQKGALNLAALRQLAGRQE